MSNLLANMRKQLISKPAFKVFKKILPPLSITEQEAMEAGGVWWDGELFKGAPDWEKLHAYPKPQLTSDEQAFLDNQVKHLLDMVDDFSIVHEQKDLPEEVWSYLKSEGFFALIIPKSYGGREFSALANSTIVSTIASRSLSLAVTVMVPNSLGPGELLMHYGTQAQKDHWLPSLANGQDVPCFALTGPEAGSDAGGIPDTGYVCKQMFEGKEVLGIRVSWNKRYITLAPRATVLGLAFKLRDPDQLLGDKEDIGITCALIPTSHEGVEIGDRHLPMGLAFTNGPTYGTDVFIPMDWVIGGQDYVGKGWRMLVECLSAGRGISLPALGSSCGQLASRMTGAYSYVRKQFGMSIGKFEGVQEAMARIGGYNYQLEASRTLTTTGLDLNEKPAIVTAIAKYHMTEMARTVIDDAMDIHAGKGIQLGPQNYLGHAYFGIPVAITVEGANILTRNLMIFGQGATRCHPYVFAELQAAAEPDFETGLDMFDKVLTKHIVYGAGNFFGALWQGLTGGKLNKAPAGSPLADYYKQLGRMSKALALSADVSMMILGGDLKRKEMISARLGDVLSHLYLASATLKQFEDRGRQAEDMPFVHYCLKNNLQQIGNAFDGFFANFSNRGVSAVLKRTIFPWGINYKAPKDQVCMDICKAMMTPGQHRDSLTHLCFTGEGEKDATGLMDRAFIALFNVVEVEKKIVSAQIAGQLPRKEPFDSLVEKALELGVITADEKQRLVDANDLRMRAIQVDSFSEGEAGAAGIFHQEHAA